MLDEDNKLLLASGSPRRREMLEQLGIPFAVFAPRVDETVARGESPESYVERVALLKMEAAHHHVLSSGGPFSAILTADTAVVCDRQILGKPRDDEDSLRMISMLCGRTHEVHTCFCLRELSTGKTRACSVTTEVLLRTASASELADYVKEGEGRDKAGAYAIQGKAAAFVRSVRGSYSSVVGLPLCELVEELRALGLVG